jgi:hypothetical protein
MIWFFAILLGVGFLSGLASAGRRSSYDYDRDDRYPEPEYDYDCGGCDD